MLQDCKLKLEISDEQARVPDAVQRFFSGAPQSRDRNEHNTRPARA